MNAHFLSRGDSILVPVGLDDSTPRVVAWAIALARLLDKRLRFVHVVETWNHIPLNLDYGESTILSHLKETMQKNAHERAAAQLNRLIAELPKDIVASQKIREGHKVTCIMAEAGEDRTSLILIHLKRREAQQNWLDGLTTPLSIMALSPVPTMIFDAEQSPPDLDRTFRILLADDMRPHTANAIQQAYELSIFFPKAEIHHVHVCDLSEEGLRVALEKRGSGSKKAMLQEICVEDILQDTCLRLEGKLTQRLQQTIPYNLSPSQNWQQKILLGGVREQLSNYARYSEPDILIFGRHHSIQQRPFCVGWLSYHFILSQNQPIIIVPEV